MRYLIAANWKMNKTVAESIDYIEIFKDLVKEVEGVEIMIAPSFTALSSVSILLEKTNISLGAQNMFYVERGAYTGEISPIMLTELNVKYVILGHSERRHIFGEKDELINKKSFNCCRVWFKAYSMCRRNIRRKRAWQNYECS